MPLPHPTTLPASMKISIVIVNYNVCYFLEQVLWSIRRAAAEFPNDIEVIVIDNASTDGSVTYLQPIFREVNFIANSVNSGFSVANNQGIALAKGNFILLLNPDTVLNENTLKACLEFMDAHPKAGALGIRMIDGTGCLLPESKRGLPTPWVSFCKLLGLSSMFPKSKWLNGYYLGHLSYQQTHAIEVLSGAFMFIRKEALAQTGGFDEQFFMYGEDIDLSYRLLLSGWKNYYLHTPPIIHYKGESTKKGSLNYVRLFYRAMMLFANKHFANKQSKIFNFFINAAVYGSAGVAIFIRLLQRLAPFALDISLIYGGLYFIKGYWQNTVKIAEKITYLPQHMLINAPMYVIIWLLSVFFSGGYDTPWRAWRTVRGLLVGTVAISAIYGFLPETLRSSRAMIVLGMGWAVVAMLGWRWLIGYAGAKGFAQNTQAKNRLVVVGSLAEAQRALNLLHEAGAGTDVEILGYLLPEEEDSITTNNIQQLNFEATANDDDLNQNKKSGYNAKAANSHFGLPCLGSLQQLHRLVSLYRLNEIIFCAKDVTRSQIIEIMENISTNLAYKTLSPNGNVLVGSNSKNTSGDIYIAAKRYKLNQPHLVRNKRLFDLGFALLLLSLFAPLALFNGQIRFLFKQAVSVLSGKKTWVGYANALQPSILPKIKPGVLPLCSNEQLNNLNTAAKAQCNTLYALDYTPREDFRIIWRYIFR